MSNNLRRWKLASRKRKSLNITNSSIHSKPAVHERLYSSALKKKEVIKKLKEEAKKAEVKECTFKPKLSKKAMASRQQIDDDRSISAPMCRPSTSIFDKITGNISSR